jgi:hypothetical protein
MQSTPFASTTDTTIRNKKIRRSEDQKIRRSEDQKIRRSEDPRRSKKIQGFYQKNACAGIAMLRAGVPFPHDLTRMPCGRDGNAGKGLRAGLLARRLFLLRGAQIAGNRVSWISQ